VPTATDTDRCAYCHTTYNLAGYGVGDAMAKTNWGNGSFLMPCLSCHSATYRRAATPTARRARAGQDGFFATTGHGRPARRATTRRPTAAANHDGDRAALPVCHLDTAAHVNTVL
jgi:hypothetical protein